MPEQAESFRHRAPLARHTDPEGRSWYSATVNRVQAASAIFALLASVAGVVWGTLDAYYKIRVLPEIDARIEAQIKVHEQRYESAFVTPKVLHDTLAPMHASAMADHADLLVIRERVAALNEQLQRVEAKIDRLLSQRR